ncbi:MAG TPA: hypothetical protein VHX68_16320 [Planctomycetaceae bacterium]|nr:hypothetical protein [Planctomycetaceae bacterium]
MSGVQGDEWIQFQPMLAAELFGKLLQLVEQAQSALGGAAGGVLVRDGISEAGQKTLLVALDDRPLEFAHGLLADLLKHLQDVRLVLRIQVVQVGVRLEHIRGTKQNGDLATLGITDAS